MWLAYASRARVVALAEQIDEQACSAVVCPHPVNGRTDCVVVQGYNAQVLVEEASGVIVTEEVSHHSPPAAHVPTPLAHVAATGPR